MTTLPFSLPYTQNQVCVDPEVLGKLNWYLSPLFKNQHVQLQSRSVWPVTIAWFLQLKFAINGIVLQIGDVSMTYLWGQSFYQLLLTLDKANVHTSCTPIESCISSSLIFTRSVYRTSCGLLWVHSRHYLS